MSENQSFGQQIHNNTVALISLFVAVMALFQNTWREDVTERNRNIRTASFEVLKNLGELQQKVNQIHFQQNNAQDQLLNGWGNIALIGLFFRAST